MAPNALRDGHAPTANDAGEGAASTSDSGVDPFASPRASLHSSIGGAASVDEALLTHAPWANPFASSTPSFAETESIGRAVSTDEPRPVAPASFRVSGSSSGASDWGHRSNSSNLSLADDVGSIGRAVSVDEPSVLGPEGLEGLRQACAERTREGDSSLGRAVSVDEAVPPVPILRQASARAPTRRESRQEWPTFDAADATEPTEPPEPPARGVGRRASVAIDALASTGQAAAAPLASTPRQRRRRSSEVDPLVGGSVASDHVGPPVSLMRHKRRISPSLPLAVPVAPGKTAASASSPTIRDRRRRSSTIDPFTSHASAAGPGPSAPQRTTNRRSYAYAPNRPTPLAEEPNPMDQAFSKVRFAPDVARDSAQRPDSERPPLGQLEGRRQSLAAGPVGRRRRSSFAGFFHGSFSARRESQIHPMDRTQHSVSTGAIPSLPNTDAGAGAPPRSQSFAAAAPRFTHPFSSRAGKGGVPLQSARRRASDPMARRPSTFQRVLSVSERIVPENPIPVRYRSRSISSVAFFVTPMKRNNSVNPIFEEDIVAEKDNVREFLEAAKLVQQRDTRSPWQKEVFRYAYLLGLLALVYFVFVGRPLWQGVGSVYYGFMHETSSARTGVVAVFISWAAAQGCLPLLFGRFEAEVDDVESRDASETALIIPAYKAANVLPETIIAALRIFRKEQIYIIANGNNPTPMDDTADVCQRFGVNHAWVPIGSKIVAEFVGVALTHKYKYIMLIDDDVHLPANLPLVTHRITGNTKCIGYTIKSTGANGARGTLIQQCQDMEYKASGLGRTFSGTYGSATFPHGAIILWDRECIQNLFNVHPGFVISEDWYFGHCARASGCRIQFCSQVFVETETPPALFKSSSAARGGFGEMTVYKQRFYRWNYFFVHRIYDDGAYLLLSWRLGFREIVTKFYVLIELYDSSMALLRPWIVVLTLMGNAKLFFEMAAGLTVMYCLIFTWFNAFHLRKKNEMIQWKVLPVYLGMKFVLLWVTCASVYYSVIHYAIYFMKKHPRVVESTQALEAAYHVRLGTALVPLSDPSTEAASTPKTGTRVSSSTTGGESMWEKEK